MTSSSPGPAHRDWGYPRTRDGGYPYFDVFGTECLILTRHPMAKIAGLDTSRHQLVWKLAGVEHRTRISGVWAGYTGVERPDPLAPEAEAWHAELGWTLAKNYERSRRVKGERRRRQDDELVLAVGGSGMLRPKPQSASPPAPVRPVAGDRIANLM